MKWGNRTTSHLPPDSQDLDPTTATHLSREGGGYSFHLGKEHCLGRLPPTQPQAMARACPVLPVSAGPVLPSPALESLLLAGSWAPAHLCSHTPTWSYPHSSPFCPRLFKDGPRPRSSQQTHSPTSRGTSPTSKTDFLLPGLGASKHPQKGPRRSRPRHRHTWGHVPCASPSSQSCVRHPWRALGHGTSRGPSQPAP